MSILPSEKQDNIIGRPAPVSFRKVFYGIVYVLECLKNWRQCMEDRCCQRIMVQVRHVIEDISNGQYKLFDSGLAKKVYDAKVEIQ